MAPPCLPVLSRRVELAGTAASFYWQLAGSIHRDIPLDDEGEPEEFNRYLGYFLDEHEAFQGRLREPLRRMAEATYLEAIAQRREPRAYLRRASWRASVAARRTTTESLLRWSRVLRARPAEALRELNREVLNIRSLVPTEAYLVADVSLMIGILTNAAAQMSSRLDILAAGVAVYAGWLIADIASYMIHVNSDGWGSGMGSKIFHDHHTYEDEAARWTWLRAIATTAPKVLPFMFLLAVRRPHFAFAIAGMVFLQGLLITPKIHGLAHHRNPGVLIGALQKYRVLLSPARHAGHHRQLDRGFSGLSGWSNNLMDALGYPGLHAAIRSWMGSVPPRWIDEKVPRDDRELRRSWRG